MTATVNASTSAGVIVTSDTSGALALQTAGTTALTVTSGQLVGIGTTSAQSKLTVAGTSPAASSPATYPGTIQINETALSTLQATGGLEFRGAVFGSGYGSKITSSDTGDLIFGSRSNSASWTETMRLTSAGYVTTPNQPAFSVYGTSLTGTTYLGGTTGLNVGSFFNTSTGIFTAPIAGNYLFSFSLSTADANSQFINIAKNGSLYAGNMLQYNIAFLTGSQTLIIPLAANDTVNAAVRDNTYAIYNARFCGYLLG